LVVDILEVFIFFYRFKIRIFEQDIQLMRTISMTKTDILHTHEVFMN